jgi:endonuclease G
MCPHGDRTANNEMSFATFVMTNIIPQAPNVNRKAWAQLEVYCRELVRSGHHLYIVAGPDGQGGRGSHGAMVQCLHNGQIRVPAGCWKIVVVLNDEAGDDLARISPETRVIAVEMPNDNSAVGEEWAKFRTTVAQIEQRTGLKFFDKLTPEVAQKLECKRDDQYIAPPRPLMHGNGE